MVKVLFVAPGIAPPLASALLSIIHWYIKGAEPRAVTENFAVPFVAHFCEAGCEMMVGAKPLSSKISPALLAPPLVVVPEKFPSLPSMTPAWGYAPLKP